MKTILKYSIDIRLVALAAALLLGGCLYPEGVWEEGLHQGKAQQLRDMHARVLACAPGPQRQRVLAALEGAQRPEAQAQLTTLQINDLRAALTGAVADGAIDDAELKPLLHRLDAMQPRSVPD